MINQILSLTYIGYLTIFWYYSLMWFIKFRNKDLSKQYKKVAIQSLKIQTTILPLLGFIFTQLYPKVVNIEYALSKPEFSIHEFNQWFLMFIWEDVSFWCIHKTLHLPLLYRWHKLHHKLTNPVPWGSIYATYTENALLNFLPVMVAPLLVRLKLFYIPIWLIIATISSLLSHSGVTEHDVHHKEFLYNYGPLGFVDRIMGTHLSYDEYINHKQSIFKSSL
jgi:sterol desaturase/sphingolipid hydroxylase (fatty acid hydroxylase superfamily)